MTTPAIQVKDLQKSFKDNHVLSGVHFEVSLSTLKYAKALRGYFSQCKDDNAAMRKIDRKAWRILKLI